MEPERIERLQLERLKQEVDRVDTIPFHRLRWDEAKFHPSMLRTLADIDLIPHYSIDDIRASIAACSTVWRLSRRERRRLEARSDQAVLERRDHRQAATDAVHPMGS